MAWQPNPAEGSLSLFRALNDQEEQEFRDYARQKDPPDLIAWEMYHPVCRDEWIKRSIRLPEKRL